MMFYVQLFYEFFKVGLFAIGGGLATYPFLHELGPRTGWFTVEELADMLGVHRATLVRCIHALRAQGIVSRFTRNALDITDPAALRRIAEQ